MRIWYASTDVEVLPGDRVTFRRWFRDGEAEIVYVPGHSPPNATFGDEYVQEVGVRAIGNRVYGVIVEPGTSRLKASVRFVSRGSQPGPLPAHLDDCVIPNDVGPGEAEPDSTSRRR